jgi:hypothetical protein
MTIKTACINSPKIHIVSAYGLFEFERAVARQKDPRHMGFDHLDLSDAGTINVRLA